MFIRPSPVVSNDMADDSKESGEKEEGEVRVGDLVRWHKRSGIPGMGLVLVVFWPPRGFDALHVEVLWANGRRWCVAMGMIEVVCKATRSID